MIAHVTPDWDKDQYSSPYQRKSTDSFAGTPIGNQPQFLLYAVAQNMPPNAPVWFRVIDPPDSAPYAAGTAHVGDNKDTPALGALYTATNAPGTLYTSDGRSAPINVPIFANLDNNDSFTVALEGSDHVAGDNYQVIASVDPPGPDGRFPCEGPGNCARSGVITVWKRLYFEEARMAKAGAFLAREVVGGPIPFPCSLLLPCEIFVRSVAVDGIDVIRAGTDITLIGTGGGINQPSANPHSENVRVDADSPTLGPAVFMVAPERFRVRLTTRPVYDYVGGPRKASWYDAVVAGPDVWTADTSGVNAVLNDAFVEYVPAQHSALVPYMGIMIFEDWFNLRRWMRNREATPPWLPELNHRFVIAVDRYEVNPANAAANPCGTDLGLSASGLRYSYIFGGTVQGGVSGPLSSFYHTPTPHDQQRALPAGCGGWNLSILNGHSDEILYGDTAHEVVHQFSVNYFPNVQTHDGSGHCMYPSDYSGAYHCLMDAGYPASAAPNQLSNYIVNLHSGSDSEYTTMREERDPSQ